MSKRKTTREFINDVLTKYPDYVIKYRYDKVNYKTAHTKIWIYCNFCNEYFKQSPSKHLHGRGCRKCQYINLANKKRKSIELFLKESIDFHGDKYGYDKVEYVNNYTDVSIYCKTCKKYFKRKPREYLSGCGCRKCGYEKIAKEQRKTKEQFIKESIGVHGDKYGYDEVVYINLRTKVKVWCNTHKKYFWISPNNHIYQKQGCPICRESKGEKEIRKCLDKYNFKYIQEKRFNDCRNKRPLPFDFFLPGYDVCIEYQGEQHYMKIKKMFNKVFTNEESEKEFEKVKKHDKIKKNYCLINNINLIEIPYWDFSNVESYINTIK